MPHAIGVQNEKGRDGVVVILMESQGLPADELFKWMVKKFPKNTCVVVPGQGGLETEPKGPGLPHGALIGVDGTVLWTGSPNGAVSATKKLIDEELAKAKSGWGKSPEAKKARAAMFGKGRIGDAAAILAAGEQSVKEDAKADFEEAKAELEARYAARKKSVAYLMEEGRYADAHKAATLLLKDAKGKAEWESEAAALVEAFKQPDAEKELKADQAFAKTVAALGDKPPKDDAAGPFKAFAKKYAGTKAAERAEAYAAACVYKPR